MRKLFVLCLALLLLLTSLAPMSMAEEAQYPEKLKIMTYLSEHLSSLGAKDNNDNYVYKTMQEWTGTEVEWIHPAAGSDFDMQINLMIASNDLPDMIVRNMWKNINGGLTSWCEDGVIQDLTDLIPQAMPNYWKKLSALPMGLQDVTVDGRMYYVADFSETSPWAGMFIRQDWLDALKLDMPTTPDALFEVLKAFRDGDPNGNGQKDEWALSAVGFRGAYGLGRLLWAFGTTYDFMQIDGQIVYGPMEPTFQDGMDYIAKLYKEGLIDPDYASHDTDVFSGKMINSIIGSASYAQPTKIRNAVTAPETFAIAGIPHLSLDGGPKGYEFGTEYISNVTSYCDLVLTSACKEPVKALRWVDEFYSDKGELLTNLGLEGYSYTIGADGKPVADYAGAQKLFPDVAEGDLKRLFTFQGLSTFPSAGTTAAYRMGLHPEAVAAILVWEETADTSRALPTLALNAEESAAINDILIDIQTYIDVQIERIVNGQISADEVPAIQQKLKDMGIDKCIAAYQSAYDRYMGK